MPHRDGVEEGHGHASELGVADGVKGRGTGGGGDAVEFADGFALTILGLNADAAVGFLDDGTETTIDDLWREDGQRGRREEEEEKRTM